MISSKYLPSHILRLFTWEVLKTNTSMTVVNNVVPMLPIDDEPKVADSGKSYIIYGYSETDGSGPEQIRSGVISFRVIAGTSNELGQIINVIASTFESRDVATEAVNRWSSSFSGGALKGIRFTEVFTTYVEGGEAADTEGGRVDGVVNVTYRYVTDYKPTLPISGGLWS